MAAVVEAYNGLWSNYTYFFGSGNSSESVSSNTTITVPSGLSNSVLVVMACGGARGDLGHGPWASSISTWVNGLSDDSWQDGNTSNTTELETDYSWAESVGVSYFINPPSGTLTFGATFYGYKNTADDMGITLSFIYAAVISNVATTSLSWDEDFGFGSSSETYYADTLFASSATGDCIITTVSNMCNPHFNTGSIAISNLSSGFTVARAAGGIVGTPSTSYLGFSASSSTYYTRNYHTISLLLPGLPDPLIHVPLSFFG